MNKPIVMRVRDLGLAAALVSIGYEVNQTYKDPNGRTYFVFMDVECLKTDAERYWADTLMVKARNFMDNTKMLKSVIYAE